MSNEDKKRIIESATNEHMLKKFDTDIGIDATIQRETVQNETAKQGNEKLRDIGELCNPIPDTLKYLGSAAVHVYQSEMLGQIFFSSQAQTLQDCPEFLASKALDDLRGTAMEFYGRSRQKKRSGF